MRPTTASPHVPTLVAIALACILAAADARAQGPEPGWRRVDLPAAGSRAWRYLPSSAAAAAAKPVVIFLHGAGSSPEAWRPFLEGPAEATGAVVIAPAPTDRLGWGIGDDTAAVAEALDRVGEELRLDRSRVGLAGHSAGGAYAYFLAYSTRGGFSGVFSFSAPFRFVLGVADPRYTAPILLWYGAEDPNFLGGQAEAVAAMMEHRGIPWDAVIVPGLGHSGIRQEDLAAGFAFLLGQRYPVGNILVPKAGARLHGSERLNRGPEERLPAYARAPASSRSFSSWLLPTRPDSR